MPRNADLLSVAKANAPKPWLDENRRGTHLPRDAARTGDRGRRRWGEQPVEDRQHQQRQQHRADHANADPGSPASHRVEYTYDYLDLRIRKSVDGDGDGPNAPTYTYQVQRGDELALEFSDPDGLDNPANPTTLAHRYLYGPAVDQILAVEDESGEVLWGLADHQGTIRDVVDSSANLQLHRVYDAFGNITSETGAVDFLFAFTGRPFDEDTGLYDYRARWYDPEVGRFLSEDVAGFDTGDMNLYRHVGNSPLDYTDPSGMEAYAGSAGSPVMPGMDSLTTAGVVYHDMYPCPHGAVSSSTDWRGSYTSSADFALGYAYSDALTWDSASHSIEIPVSGSGLYAPVVPTVSPPKPPTAAVLGSLWSYAISTNKWLWQHGGEEAIVGSTGLKPVVEAAKIAYHQSTRAYQVAQNAQEAAYGVLKTSYGAGGVVLGDLTGVIPASYLMPGVEARHGPVTGSRCRHGSESVTERRAGCN